MGNFVGKSHWNDQQVMQSWLPMLTSIFTYDPTGVITGVNMQYFSGDPTAANDQLKALPLLLKGKSGVGRKTLKHIKLAQTQLNGNIPNQNQQPLQHQQSRQFGNVQQQEPQWNNQNQPQLNNQNNMLQQPNYQQNNMLQPNQARNNPNQPLGEPQVVHKSWLSKFKNY